MQFDDGPGDAKAKTGAADPALVGHVLLGELVEDLILERRFDPAAEIAHRKTQHPVMRLRRQLDRGTRRRKLGRVGQQVREHLHQAPLIAVDRKRGHRVHD